MIELKNFIHLTHEERLEVLTWRNHESVRAHMYTSEPIRTDDHLNFIDSLTSRHDKLYCVVIKNNHPIGVVDLVDITDTTASLGLYANPFSERQGIGTIILRALLRHAFERLKLQKVFLEYIEDNTKAKALYNKFDFIPTHTTIKHGVNVVCMELSREHWPTRH